MYDLRKQPPFCPLKNQVKRPGAALTRMTACCYKVKFCYFPPLSMQQPMARSTQKNSIWSPSYPLCHCPREFSKRNPDQDSTTITSLPFTLILAEIAQRKMEQTLAKWPRIFYLRAWSQMILDRIMI